MNDRTIPDFTPLTGQLLMASPGMDDERFEKSVIYVYNHTEEDGALGLVINKPAEKISFQEILTHLHITEMDVTPPPVYLGGPEQVTHGFILHSRDYQSPQTIPVSGTVALTATQDILRDIVTGHGPQHYLMTLGCASWRRGQLEEEIMGNLWITAPADEHILFQTPYHQKWNDSLRLIGVDPYRLSGQAGKA